MKIATRQVITIWIREEQDPEWVRRHEEAFAQSVDDPQGRRSIYAGQAQLAGAVLAEYYFDDNRSASWSVTSETFVNGERRATASSYSDSVSCEAALGQYPRASARSCNDN